jgi:hypothetical protein
MHAISKIIRILQLSVAVLFLHAQAFADSPAPPHDFKTVTENKKYVFVMLVPDGWAGQHDLKMRRVYKQSGLYKNDGSSTPLWIVDWYAFEVYPSSDGEHLIRMGPWASSTDQLALSFHKKGKDIKSYRIKDLVRDDSKLGYSASHFLWWSELKYDDTRTVLFLRTRDNRAYRFSAETGEILR